MAKKYKKVGQVDIYKKQKSRTLNNVIGCVILGFLIYAFLKL